MKEIGAIHFVEASSTLRSVQAREFLNSKDVNYIRNGGMEGLSKDGIKIRWYESIEEVIPLGYPILLAHEFFDALPVYQFEVLFTFHF